LCLLAKENLLYDNYTCFSFDEKQRK